MPRAEAVVRVRATCRAAQTQVCRARCEGQAAFCAATCSSARILGCASPPPCRITAQSIKDAFKKQQAAGAAPPPSVKLVLEVADAPKVVPDLFLDEALKIHDVSCGLGVAPCMPRACWQGMR